MGLFSAIKKSHKVKQIQKKIKQDYSYASNPGRMRLYDNKLKRWHPHFYDINVPDSSLIIVDRIRKYLWDGDAQPGIVVQAGKNTAIVSAYSDEFDQIFYMLFIGDSLEIFKQMDLNEQAKPLVVVWGYGTGPESQPDIIHGPKSSYRWSKGWPVIADALTTDHARLIELKENFGELTYLKLYNDSQMEANVRKPLILRGGTPHGAFNEYYNLTEFNNSAALSN